MDDRLFDQVPVGLGALDGDLRWVRANAALAELNGHTVDELLGRTPSELHGELGERYEELLREVLATGERTQGVIAGELTVEPGRWREWEVQHFPLGDGVG